MIAFLMVRPEMSVNPIVWMLLGGLALLPFLSAVPARARRPVLIAALASAALAVPAVSYAYILIYPGYIIGLPCDWIWQLLGLC